MSLLRDAAHDGRGVTWRFDTGCAVERTDGCGSASVRR
jgi:hypothetical protein